MRHSLELTDGNTSLAELLDVLERLVLGETRNESLAGEIRLVAEEALTNVIKYGYERLPRPSVLARVELAFGEREVALEIRDAGTAFDPLAEPSPDVDAPPESRREGGLGIHLLRSLADEVHYRREDDANVLSLKKRIG